MPDREKMERVEPGDQDGRQEEIALIAYSYWQSRGCVDGYDVEDWLMAEQEVEARHAPRRPELRKEARTAA
jgi:Protein of unknown function (DUF2934)